MSKKINTLFFETLSSTSTYARENIASLSLPSLIIANEQTAGRGRRGNSFFSPKDTGLYMTLVFEPFDNCELLTPNAAVAVCRVLEGYGLDPKIKWVNDIFIGNKKVCGILSERFTARNEKTVVAIGIGINLTTSAFPDELSNAGSIGVNFDKVKLAEEISDSLSGNDTVNVIYEYKKRLFILGKTVFYKKNNVEYSAEAIDINEECNLIVKHTDGSLDMLSSGEISIKF